MGSIADNEALLATERALAEDLPFGSYEYISTRVFAQYVELLSTVAESAPGARALLDSVGAAKGELKRIVLGDSLVRRTIEDGACLYLLGRDAIDDQTLNGLLAAADEHARRDRVSLLAGTTGCVSISSSSHHGFVWAGAVPHNAVAHRFTTQCLGRLPIRIEQPTEEILRNIVEGAAIVDTLLPELGRSALSHTSMVVVATPVGDFKYKSMTVPGLPGVIFLSPAVLASPVLAADALFHESMHLKLMDIDYAEHLFAPGFRPQSSPTVSPPWHSGDQKQRWPLDRILTAMHVYTGLAVFFGRSGLAVRRSSAIDSSEYPVDSEMKYQRAVERAHCLLGMARDHLNVFSAAGRSFIDWIAETHKNLDGPIFQPQRASGSG